MKEIKTKPCLKKSLSMLIACTPAHCCQFHVLRVWRAPQALHLQARMALSLAAKENRHPRLEIE